MILEHRRSFPAVPASVGEARRDLVAFLDLVEISPERCDDTLLMLSELMTNAITHSGSDQDIELRAGPDRDGQLRVEVIDGGRGFQPFPSGSLGLRLVEKLADDWGVERDPDTCVWFQVRL